MELISDFVIEYTRWIRFVHIAGAIVALGAVTAVDLLLLLFKLKPSELGRVVVRVAPIFSLQVWIGLFLISVSGLLMFIPAEGLEGYSVFQLKMILVLALFLNGIFLNAWINPKFEELLPEWESKTPRIKKFTLIAGVSTAISFVSWWGVIFIMWVLY